MDKSCFLVAALRELRFIENPAKQKACLDAIYAKMRELSLARPLYRPQERLRGHSTLPAQNRCEGGPRPGKKR